MTPEERAQKLLGNCASANVQRADLVTEIRAAVEEEREACRLAVVLGAALFNKSTGQVECGLCDATGPGSFATLEHKKDCAYETIRARGKEKYCGCGHRSVDPTTGGCGEC